MNGYVVICLSSFKTVLVVLTGQIILKGWIGWIVLDVLGRFDREMSTYMCLD